MEKREYAAGRLEMELNAIARGLGHNPQKQQKPDYSETIKALKLLLAKLEVPMRSLKKTAERERQQREKRQAELLEYQTEREIEDAYGYEHITDNERRELLKKLQEGRDYVEETETAASRASTWLARYMRDLRGEMQHYEFEMLPESEQIERRKKADEWQAYIQSLKDKKKGPLEDGPAQEAEKGEVPGTA